jgi:HAD superfamily hydrolase (TIGR01509 family)
MTLLIFDCDGVLVDSEPLANEILAEMLTALGRPMTAAESMRTQIGKSLADILRETRAMTGREIPDDVGAAMNAKLFARFRDDLRAMPDVAGALDALPFPRCLASSSQPARIALALEVTGLAPLFDRRFSAVEVERGKPAPDLFLHAAHEMGFAPSDCIVVEDSVAGAQAARAADMRCIGFTGGGHADAGLTARLREAGAKIVVAHMHDLPAAVGGLRRF